GVTVAANAESTGSPAKPAGKVEYVGHRGASYDYPENTLASFNAAWKDGADGCENDIQLTKDGKVIILHDADTLRTTGGPTGGGMKLAVKDTDADQLRKLDVGKWKGDKWAGEKMPFLDECLATIPNGKRFFIEIKSGVDVVPAAAEVIKNSGKR